MKVIDLLNKIANGEEVPKKIHYNCVPLYWCEPCKIYETMRDGELCGKDLYTLLDNLNDEVEIIGEEKKIPEKIIPTSLKGIDNLDEKIEIAHIDTISVIETVNQVLDYLKSKGE